mgnify:CR=1 FL=1
MPHTQSYSLTIRAEIESKIGNFGRVMAAIGAADAEVGALAEAKLDSFVRALRTGSKRGNAVGTGGARAAA